MCSNEESTLGDPPWTSEQVEDLCRKDFQSAHEIIKQHPGFEWHDAISMLKLVYEIFDRSVSDFLTALYEIHHESHFGGLYNRRNQSKYRELEISVQLSLFSATQTAMAIVDHTRVATRNGEIPGVQARIDSEFSNDGSHRFVQELRNFLAHKRLSEISRTLTSGTDGRTTTLKLQPMELLNTWDWCATARSYIQSQSDGIDLEELLIAYREKVREFHVWTVVQIEQMHIRSIQEYLSHKCQVRAFGARMWWNLIISQMVIQAGRDPYVHLVQFLSDEELDRVNALPRHSQEQVNLIITLIDEDGACDDQLRRKIYDAFNVDGS